MKILGLDASTSTIGIAIIKDDGYNLELIYNDFYKPEKENGILDMIIKARTHILNIAKEYSIDHFVIEDYVRFMKDNSTAKTIIPLALLNMSLRLAAIDSLQLEPNFLSVLKIRHTLKKGKDQFPSKEDMPDLVAYHLGIDFPWREKFSPRKKKMVILEESYDIADAIAVALTFIRIKNTIKKIKPKIKKLKKKKSKVII